MSPCILLQLHSSIAVATSSIQHKQSTQIVYLYTTLINWPIMTESKLYWTLIQILLMLWADLDIENDLYNQFLSSILYQCIISLSVTRVHKLSTNVDLDLASLHVPFTVRNMNTLCPCLFWRCNTIASSKSQLNIHNCKKEHNLANTSITNTNTTCSRVKRSTKNTDSPTPHTMSDKCATPNLM